MSTLSSTSTDAQVTAAYDDNASYAEDKSVTKAKAFLTAIRILLRRTAEDVAHGTERITMAENLRQYREELRGVQQWLVANDTTDPTARATSFEYLRA